MQFARTIQGGMTPIILTYKIGATVIPGQVVISAASQMTDATTTSFADAGGVVLNLGGRVGQGSQGGTLTYSTTQGDTEGLADVASAWGSVFRALLTQGATNNTALTTFSQDTAETAGTTLTDSDIGTATMAAGLLWRVDNNDQSRTITTFNASTSVVVTVPFAQDIAAADTFHMIPANPGRTTALQLTGTFDQINAAIAVGTGGNVRVAGVELNGATNSYVHLIFSDPYLGQTGA